MSWDVEYTCVRCGHRADDVSGRDHTTWRCDDCRSPAVSEPPEAHLARIREILFPSDNTYCAEPIDIEDSRWLLAEVERLTGQRAAALHALEDAIAALDRAQPERTDVTVGS